MEVHTAALPQAAAQWATLPETSLAAPMELPVYNDPASAAVAAAMADWPGIHEARTAQRTAAAHNLVSASHYTSVAFMAADDRGARGADAIADQISGSEHTMQA